MKFRKKPVVIEAVQWVAENALEIMNWLPPDGFEPVGHFASFSMKLKNKDSLNIRTLEGVMTASYGDWIIKGIRGEFYPIKNEIFLETYEAVDADQVEEAE